MHDFWRFIGPLFINVGELCAADPPPFPSFDEFDAINVAIGGRGGLYVTAAEKFKDVMRWAAWYVLCECNSGGTPARPAPPAPPSDLPVINPPVLVPPIQAQPCAVAGYVPHTMTNGDGTYNRAGVAFHNAIAPRWGRFSVTNQTTTGPGWTLSTTPRWGSGAGQINLPLILTAPNTTQVRTYPVPSDPSIWSLEATTNAAAGVGTVVETMSAEIFCGNDLPGLEPECCAPDPTLMARLNQVLDMVTLLQRQGEPFAYVPGPAVHAGLVGIGELDVEGLIGVLVEVTNFPPGLGHLVGMPEMLFDVGWLTIGTADGWERRIRIDSAEQLVIPAHMGLVTRVGYSLSPNVVISVHELVREP